MKKIAIVGSRRMSGYGREVIEKFKIYNLQFTNKKIEIVTIGTGGCNAEIGKFADKIFKGENFEKLNEEVAEYADCLVIIEGGQKSGTILLAEKFVEKNKLVYCVPGRITDENSWACNWLISQGAIPWLSFDQLID